MSDLIEIYDNWVNGTGLSAFALWRSIGKANFSENPRLALPISQGSTVMLPRFHPSGWVIQEQIAENLPTISHILVHGSQATNDMCDFSDVDIAVIVNDELTFSESQHTRSILELRRLLRSIYSYDPLMHHGLMFMRRSALAAFDQSFLPLETLRLSKLLHGHTELVVCLAQSDRQTLRRRLLNAMRSLQNQISQDVNLRGDFQLKNFVAGVLLLPAVFLAQQGIFVYKRESFAMAQPYFSENAWTFITAAEQIRQNWIRPLDSRLKSTVSAWAHPRLRILLSAKFPTNINLRQPTVRKSISDLNQCAAAFESELMSALD